MAIYRLLAQSSFDPEDISRMTAAYEECLRLLKLANRADPITELVAKHIIEVARTGERDPSKICALTLERIGIQKRCQALCSRPRRGPNFHLFLSGQFRPLLRLAKEEWVPAFQLA